MFLHSEMKRYWLVVSERLRLFLTYDKFTFLTIRESTICAMLGTFRHPTQPS